MSPYLSGSNERIKQLRRLSGRRSSRAGERRFVIEGPVLIAEAVAAGLDIDAVYVDADAEHLAAGLGGATLPAWDLHVAAPGVLGSVLAAVAPQPVCAVAQIPDPLPLDEVFASASETGRPVLVLADLADPGNAGTLIRTAEASGCAAVIVAGEGVDVYNPKVVRSSAGSLFRVDVVVYPDVSGVLQSARERGVCSVAAVARHGTDHVAAQLGGAVAVVLGNEAHGLADDVVAACDRTVTIALDGEAESLNVAAAGAVLCFEALRQRRAAAGVPH